MGSFDVLLDDERTQLDAFVEEYRSALEVTLDCLTEEQARRRKLVADQRAQPIPSASPACNSNSMAPTSVPKTRSARTASRGTPR